MTQENTAATERLTLTGRVGSSRKLLQRKGAEKAASAPASDPLEESFPPPAMHEQNHPQEPQSGSSSAPAAGPAPVPAALPAWSSEDEAALQALTARRKAAGYQRRGRDVSGQRLQPGKIKPNPDTVVATIVGIVAERGELGRAELLDLLAGTSFPHPKAQPQDKGWCQRTFKWPRVSCSDELAQTAPIEVPVDVYGRTCGEGWAWLVRYGGFPARRLG